MLPAERRVRRREEFTSTVRHGHRAGGPALVVHLATTGDDVPARAGFIVGRAVGPAVRRNRLRRQLRHLISLHLERLPRGSVVIVRATPSAATTTGRELSATLDALLARAERSRRGSASA